MENVDGYEGEKELMSKFGLDIQDDATFIVARRRWEQFVSVDNNIIVSSDLMKVTWFTFQRKETI